MKNKNITVFLIIFFVFVNFLYGEISIEPFSPLVIEYEKGKIFTDKIYIYDKNLENKGVRVIIKNKYKNSKIDSKDWIETDKDYYLFDNEGKIEVLYTIKMPKNLKKELACELSFEFESKTQKVFTQVYTTSIYLEPKNKKINIKVDLGNIKLDKNKNKNIHFEIHNKSNFHIRPKLELICNKNNKSLFFYDGYPVFPDEKKVFKSYDLYDNFIDYEKNDYKLKIIDKENKINVSKNIVIKKR